MSPAGLDPVCLRYAAWYRRPAESQPAGCPACGSREALHLATVGDQRCAWYTLFTDLTQSPLPPVGVLGPTPLVFQALLGILQPWVHVLGRSTHRSFPMVIVACLVLCARRPANSSALLNNLAGWRYDAGDHGRLSPGGEPLALLDPLYAVELQCSNCGKLRAAEVSQASAPPPGAPRRGLSVYASTPPRPSPWR